MASRSFIGNSEKEKIAREIFSVFSHFGTFFSFIRPCTFWRLKVFIYERSLMKKSDFFLIFNKYSRNYLQKEIRPPMAKLKTLPSERRIYSLPEPLIQRINEKLGRYNLSLTNSIKIADAVLFMSDFYIENPDQPTPWNERLTWIAQLAYYFPLNYLRNHAVVEELKQHMDLNSFSKIIDFGAGLGTSAWCFKTAGYKNKILQFERETKLKNIWDEPQFEWINNEDQLHKQIDRNTLGVFSYSITEVNNLLPLLEKFNYLMIIEPSTQDDGRKLMELREKLIAKDFHVLAPCTHQQTCPLLSLSKKDWCHDRIHFKKPDWFQKIENQLPIKNDTLTFSYLLVEKKKLKKSETKDTEVKIARLTGDLMNENGKSRQLLCMNSERLFLTWMHKTSLVQDIGRGSLIELPENTSLTANELRITSDNLVKVLR